MDDLITKVKTIDAGLRRLERMMVRDSYKGFDRTITEDVIVGPDASIIINQYCTIAAGGSLTIKAGGELLILSSDPPRFSRPYKRETTASGPLAATDDYLVINVGTANTVSLPPVASVSGYYFRLTNIGAGTSTISGDANINGSVSQALAQWESADLYSTGSIWIMR